jgi:hypothetical protein
LTSSAVLQGMFWTFLAKGFVHPNSETLLERRTISHLDQWQRKLKLKSLDQE